MQTETDYWFYSEKPPRINRNFKNLIKPTLPQMSHHSRIFLCLHLLPTPTYFVDNTSAYSELMECTVLMIHKCQNPLVDILKNINIK